MPYALRPALTPALFRDAYVTFYPVATAVARGFVEVIGTLVSGGMPHRFRRPEAISRDGKVMTWIIEDDSSEVLRLELTPEERRLPIAEIWNHEMLIDRILHQWRPDDEN